MIVQIDEAWDNKGIAGINHGRGGKSGGDWGSSGGDSFHEAVVSEVNAAGKHSGRVCAAHGNNAAGDYKRHRCLRFILYLRVEGLRTEIVGGPDNSLYVVSGVDANRVVVFVLPVKFLSPRLSAPNVGLVPKVA
jgi:hypothetical protein